MLRRVMVTSGGIWDSSIGGLCRNPIACNACELAPKNHQTMKNVQTNTNYRQYMKVNTDEWSVQNRAKNVPTKHIIIIKKTGTHTFTTTVTLYSNGTFLSMPNHQPHPFHKALPLLNKLMNDNVRVMCVCGGCGCGCI